MNYIELFAGCGGLSLGLEAAGFSLLMANEFSPMASETFAYNILGADLSNAKNVDKVLWISSQHSREQLRQRLRENPYDTKGISSTHFSDLNLRNYSDEDLRRSLWIGSIVDLNKVLAKKRSHFFQSLKCGFGDGSVDLVSGGPPCQSFSLAGLRDHSNHRNKLLWEFARFTKAIQPKIALLENVSGILRPFKVRGKRYYAWFELAKALAKAGYVPLCLYVNAKYVGAPQNRPRFIMIALRKDIYLGLKKSNFDDRLIEVLAQSKKFFDRIRRGENLSYECLKYFDIEKERSLFENSILSYLFAHTESNLISVKDAIDDLHAEGGPPSEYVRFINGIYNNKFKLPLNKSLNHELRKNGNVVRARFRLYQVANKYDKEVSREIASHIRSYGAVRLSSGVIKSLKQHWLIGEDGKRVDRITASGLRQLLKTLYSSKHSQRVMTAGRPAPTVLGSPDDSGHYYESEATQRTLSVRELARIQSFPDWYELRSKITTGGRSRKFEVPQYTQVGNAVPPLLGLALGKICSGLINA